MSVRSMVSALGVTCLYPTVTAVGGDLDLDLQGTWELNGTVVTFDLPDVDTFVRDVPFTVGTNTLTGDRTSNGTRLQVVLTKRPAA
jgi:hypothetical protein